MSIAIKNLDDGRGVLIFGKGFISEKEFVSTHEEHLIQDKEKFKKYRYSISDFAEVTGTDVSNEAITVIAELCRSSSTVNPDIIVATITSKDLIYGLSRMMQMLIGETDWEFEIFRNKEDAKTWIKKRIKEKYEIDDLAMA